MEGGTKEKYPRNICQAVPETKKSSLRKTSEILMAAYLVVA
jgi:hypothetical protein